MLKNLLRPGLLLAATTAQAADINVGPARPYQTLVAGVAAAAAGDRVLLDAGRYVDDTVQTHVPLTIEGTGAVVLRITRPITNRKGIIVSSASLTVRHLTFDGARVTKDDGNNGAGIRHQAGDLTIEDCAFINNQDGVLVDAIPDAMVKVVHTTFTGNGAGDGYSHGIYVNEVARFTVDGSVFAGTKVGHDIKSRALITTITGTVLDDGVTGTTSYAVDLPNGGVAMLDGLTITQGPASRNSTMIAYGAEGHLKAQNSLTVTHTTFDNRLTSASAVAVHNFSGVAVRMTNNIYRNLPAILRGPGKTGQR